MGPMGEKEAQHLLKAITQFALQVQVEVQAGPMEEMEEMGGPRYIRTVPAHLLERMGLMAKDMEQVQAG